MAITRQSRGRGNPLNEQSTIILNIHYHLWILLIFLLRFFASILTRRTKISCWHGHHLASKVLFWYPNLGTSENGTFWTISEPCSHEVLNYFVSRIKRASFFIIHRVASWSWLGVAYLSLFLRRFNWQIDIVSPAQNMHHIFLLKLSLISFLDVWLYWLETHKFI